MRARWRAPRRRGTSSPKQLEASPPGVLARPGGSVGARRVPPLAIECSVVLAPAAPRRAHLLRTPAASRGVDLLAFRRLDVVVRDDRGAAGARRLRALRRPLDPRVGGGADRHRDAARDAGLRARVAAGASVRPSDAVVGTPAPPLARRLR